MTMGTIRIAIVALLAAILLCGTASILMTVQLKNFESHRTAASSFADGTIVEDSIGGEDDIRVRWTDTAGFSHTSRFGIYDTDRYVEGEAFGVRFDPAHTDRRVFPSDRDETLGADDIWAGILLPWALVIGAVLWWLIRGIRAVRSRRGPSEPAIIQIKSGFNLKAGPLAGAARTTWAAVDHNGSSFFQRVQWHPHLSSMPKLSSVHIFDATTSTAIQLNDGTVLTPIGRRRDTVPDRFDLRPLTTMRSSLADSMVGARVPPHDAWLRALLMRALYGAALGIAPGILTGSTNLVWIGALVGAAATVNVWALYGADR